MREGLIRLGTAIGQHGIGEIVVFVNERVQRDAVIADIREQRGELGVNGGLREDALSGFFREQIPVALQGRSKFQVTIGFKFLL